VPLANSNQAARTVIICGNTLTLLQQPRLPHNGYSKHYMAYLWLWFLHCSIVAGNRKMIALRITESMKPHNTSIKRPNLSTAHDKQSTAILNTYTALKRSYLLILQQELRVLNLRLIRVIVIPSFVSCHVTLMVSHRKLFILNIPSCLYIPGFGVSAMLSSKMQFYYSTDNFQPFFKIKYLLFCQLSC
jgi:hypothetical protein